MYKNVQILDYLFDNHKVRVKRGSLFNISLNPLPKNFDFGRAEAMMLGLAIGDALGNTTEGMLPEERKRSFGEIHNYISDRYMNKCLGFPSDDTQLAFWTLEQMIEDREFNPENVAARYCKNRIFGIGNTVRQFIHNYNSGMPWYESGPKSAGNGALMRIAPMIIPYLKIGTTNIWVDTALSAMMTHNDSGSIAACLSLINMLWQLFQMDTSPEPEWWLETYVNTARDLELDEKYRPRGGLFIEYEGPIWFFVEQKVNYAYQKGYSVVDACNSWGSGSFLLETIPSVIFILMQHGDNVEEAITRAVNDTKDNDTIAAIVGALSGALHGKDRIPERWLLNLSGRTTDNDDGRVFKLLEDSKKLWWH